MPVAVMICTTYKVPAETALTVIVVADVDAVKDVATGVVAINATVIV